ncbi:hypothetical protein IGI39_004018 [Enterococcus sp. AZ135]
MGDMGDYWRDVKPYLKERRQKHVQHMGNSASRNIEKLGYDYKHYPNNHQFAIETKKGIIDYWGTTGTWIDRRTKKRGKGLESLRNYLSQ